MSIGTERSIHANILAAVSAEPSLSGPQYRSETALRICTNIRAGVGVPRPEDPSTHNHNQTGSRAQ